MTDVLRTLVLPRLTELGGVKPRGGGYDARCPAHPDRKASLSVSRGKDQPVVFHCHAGCDREDILAALNLTWADLSKPRDPGDRPARDTPWMTCMRDRETRLPVPGHAVAAEYGYHDLDGILVRGVSRCVQKCFRQWRPDPTRPSGRRWTTKLDDGTEVGADLVYRLPELVAVVAERHPMKARNVWIVEGEKDADRLWSLGFPASTNPQGGGGWKPEHGRWFAGADVMVVADRDESGRRHAADVVASVIDGARSVEVLQAAIGNDVSDHLDVRPEEAVAWLRANGHRTHKVDGTPILALGVHHLISVAEPKPAPAGVEWSVRS